MSLTTNLNPDVILDGSISLSKLEYPVYTKDDVDGMHDEINNIVNSVKGGIRFAGVIGSEDCALPTLSYDEMEEDPIITGTWIDAGSYEEYSKEFKIGDLIIITNSMDSYADEPNKEHILIRDNDYQIKWVELGDVTPAQGMINKSLKNYYNKEQIDASFQPIGDYITREEIGDLPSDDGNSPIVEGAAENSAILENSNNKANGNHAIALGYGNKSEAEGSLTEGISNIAGRIGGVIDLSAGDINTSGVLNKSSEIIALLNDARNEGIIEYDQEFNKVNYLPFINDNKSDIIRLVGFASHAEGENTQALGTRSHAEGYNTRALTNASHAEGNGTNAKGHESHAEGNSTQALGNQSHSEGKSTIAKGNGSHAEGVSTQALGDRSHTEGYSTIAEGYNSHAEGNETSAKGENSHTEGYLTAASGENSHAEGNETSAIGENSHTEGYLTVASGENSHAEGNSTQALGNRSHTEGYSTIAEGQNSHAEGVSTQALGSQSHSEGKSTIAKGNGSHAEGVSTQALGSQSHSEGYNTIAEGYNSHAEGNSTQALGNQSHAEGKSTIAKGQNSHAEGYLTEASGKNSHAEGQSTKVHGSESHAGGVGSIATGARSFAHGNYVNTINNDEVAFGKYNLSTKDSTIFSVGNGSSKDDRKNAFEIKNASNITQYSFPEDITLYVRVSDPDDEFAQAQSKLKYQHQTSTVAVYLVYYRGEYPERLTNLNGESLKYSLNEGDYVYVPLKKPSFENTYVNGKGELCISDENFRGIYMSDNNFDASTYIHSLPEDWFNGMTASTMFPGAEISITTGTGIAAYINDKRILVDGDQGQNSSTSVFTNGDGTNSVVQLNTGATATGVNSVATGANTIAAGNNSYATGNEAEALGWCSFAGGLRSKAKGDGSLAFGQDCVTEGKRSAAIGFQCNANGYQSFALGRNIIASNINEFGCGKFNKSDTNTIFSVGVGKDIDNRKNAFEIKKDGKIYVDGINNDLASSINTIIDTISSDTITLGDTTLIAHTEIKIGNNIKHVFMHDFASTNAYYDAGYNVVLPSSSTIKPGHTIRFYNYNLLGNSNNYYISTGNSTTAPAINLFSVNISNTNGMRCERTVTQYKNMQTIQIPTFIPGSQDPIIKNALCCFNTKDISLANGLNLTNTIFDMTWDGSTWLCNCNL